MECIENIMKIEIIKNIMKMENINLYILLIKEKDKCKKYNEDRQLHILKKYIKKIYYDI